MKKKEKTMTELLTGKQMVATDMKIEMSYIIREKLQYWVDNSPQEVSGYGSITFNKETKVFTVTDAIALDRGTSTSSTISPLAFGKAANQLYQAGHGEGSCKVHFHSHPNMSAFWSGDDMNVIRGLGQEEWIVAIVFNNKREYRAAFYQLVDVMGNKHEVFVDDIKIDVTYPEITTEMKAEWQAVLDSLKPGVNEIKHTFKHHDYSKGRDYQKKHKDYYDQMFLDDYGYRGGRDWADDTLTVKDFSADKIEMARQAALLNPNSYGLTEDWDKEGWRMNPRTNDYQYNPVRDNALKTEEIWQQIAQMDQEEFDGLLLDDLVFRTYLHSEITGTITK
jgi:proteasome lid subunit RPN8/RPN11